MRRAYQTDLSDEEWEVLEPLLPIPQAPGRLRLHPLREILDAVFYIVRGGCAWRLLPHDFPPWKTVYHYFRTGVSTAPGSGYTRPCAGGQGSGSGAILSPAPGSWTARASRPPGWAAKSAATTRARR